MTGTPHPVNNIVGIATTANVQKPTLVDYFKTRSILVVANAAEVNTTDLTGQTQFMLQSNGAFYLYDAASVAPDDGNLVLIDAAGNHFDRVALKLRDTSAAFDVTVVAASSPNISAGRTLALNMGDVAHTLALGGTANTITFPSAASFTVAGLGVSGQTFTVPQAITASVASGNAGLNITATQTQPNAGDTADTTLRLDYTLSASSATNELVTRVFSLNLTNSLTGGGHIQNARVFNLAHSTSGSTTIDSFSAVYIESGTASGTVTTGIGINISSLQGTTKYGIFDSSGGNWSNYGSSIVAANSAIPAGGTAGLGYKFSTTANYGVFFGSGAPSLSAAKGSLYLRSDGTTTNNRAYINTDGSTTWTALTTAA